MKTPRVNTKITASLNQVDSERNSQNRPRALISTLSRLGPVFLLATSMLLVAFFWLLGHPGAMHAAGPPIRYVAPVSVGGNNSGNDCTASYNPCATIQYAVNVASSGDEIRVAAGRYTDTNTVGILTQNVYLTGSVTLRGGFTTTNWVTSDPELNPTIIDAGGLGRVIYVPSAVNATVNGFHLTGGKGGTLAGQEVGGGVYNQAGNLTLENNKIYNNITTDAAGHGGGIATAATLVLNGNQIYSNTAAADGGAIRVISGIALIEANEIFSNTADNIGGLDAAAGTVTARNNLIYNNRATVSVGGGVGVFSAILNLENNTIYGNDGLTSGGGIFAFGGTVAITNNLIISNTATANGGIFSNTTLSLIYTDFFGNSPNNDINGSINPESIGVGNNRNRDPKFTDATNFDLHLLAASPAIDDGAITTTITSDYEGDGRPFDAAVGGSELIDRGADEYIAASDCYARVEGGQVYTNVQQAVDAANSGNLVQVAGLCQGVQSTGGFSQTVYISKTLTVRGGYTTTDWVNPQYGPTILDAQGGGRVLYINGTSAINPVIENLYLTGGSYTGSGGGVYLGLNVNATLRNNVIYNNTATSFGGGVYNSGGGNVTLDHNTIYNNTASQGGGVTAGTANGTGQVTLENTIVATNSATTGGGLYAPTGGRYSLNYNDFYGNASGNYGGDAITGTTDISVDPGLTNPATNNFHLKLSSLLINTADSASTLATDFENDSRPQPTGGRRDIGADESRLYVDIDLADILPPDNPHIITDTVAAQGTLVTFTHTITNIGNTGASTDTVTIDATNSHGWTITPTSQTLDLTLGVPTAFTIVVSIPITDLSGIYNQTFITATSTSNAAGVDSTVDIISNPGLEFSPDYTSFGDPDQVITYTHTLTNTGATDTFIITFGSPRNWGQAVTPVTVTLGYNESAQISVQVVVTSSAPAGLTDIMTVTATSVNYGSFGVFKTVTDTTTANPTGGNRHVSNGGSDTENNCRVSGQPCETILYALGQAADGDTVLVSQGTYVLTGTLLINQNINLRGGFQPVSFLEPPEGFDPATTIIQRSGGFFGPGLDIIATPPSQPLIENFTLQDFDNSAGAGGGIYVESNAAPTLANLIIKDSTAADGGAISIQSGDPALTNITISNTTAIRWGGGIHIDSGSPTLDNISIAESATTGGSGKGGGIYVNSGSPTVQNSSITDTVSILGGGIYLESGSAILTNSTIYSAGATTGGGIYQAGGNLTLAGGMVYSAGATTGGGIYQAGGSLTGQKLTVWQNSATAQGGGLYQVAGTTIISQTRVNSNTAGAGGGLYSASGSLTLWNNFIYGNSATTGNGGGIYKDGGTLNLVNDTLYGNQAANLGGGVFDNNSGSLVFSNTIVVANQANTGGGVYRLSSGPSSIDYNNFWNNSAASSPNHNLPSAGSNSISSDPEFVDAANGDLHLTLDSPSVDAAEPNTFLTADIEDDIRPANQGVDIGADEVTGCLARVIDLSRVPRFGGNVFGVLQEAIDAASGSDIVQISGECRGVHSRLVDGQVLSQTVFISKSLTLEGGYNSSFSNDPIGNPGSVVPTALDARGQGRTLVITATISGNPSVSLLNLTLTNGNAQGLGGGPGNNDAGGGIYNYNSFLTLNSAVITNNQAAYGGGIYHFNDTATPNMLNLGNTGQTTIISNTATGDGGGLYIVDNQSTAIRQVTFSQNNAGSNGGGLYVAGSSLTIQNDSRFEQNSANQGGGFYNAGGSLVISQTTLYSNTATTGGGLYNTGTLNGESLTINGNSTTGSGGGLYNHSSGQLSLDSSLILTNTAGADGGGLYNVAGSSSGLTLINSIVFSNTAGGNGGGLYNQSDYLTLRHNTFYANQGDGIYHDAGTSLPVINSTMIVSNTGNGITSIATAPTFKYNDVVDNGGVDISGFSPPAPDKNISATPSFISVDPANPNFLRINSGSRGEEEGDPASPVTDDIDGDPRPSNQDFDIGVDEIADCFVQINGVPPTYGKVQVAVGLSNPGDEIRVAGICQGVDPFDDWQTVSQTVFITKSLIIRGGYTKDNFTTSDPIANPTILDALDLGRVIYITNTAQVTVAGLHLQRGNAGAAGGSEAGNGGGLFVGNGVLTMTQNQVYSNTATNGGALYNQAGTVYIFEDIFTNTLPFGIFTNTATTAGGAIYNAGGNTTLDTVDVRNNQAASSGGAVYHAGGATLLQNNIIRNNSVSTGDGGAIYNAAGGLTAWHNTIYSNSAGGDGGGLHTTTGDPDVRNNIFRNNSDDVIFSTTPYTITYNNFSGSGSNSGGSVTFDATNLVGDPWLAADPVNAFFRIPDNSPVIDQGDPTMPAFQDFENDYRPGDQNFDMGADERRSCWAKVTSSGIIYGNIQRAIDNSQPDDTILVTRGECRGVHTYFDGAKTLSQTVHITHNLTLQGGYTRDFSSQVGGPLSQFDSTATTLNARTLGRVILVTGSITVDIHRFIVTNGDATGQGGGPGGGDAGGGFYHNGAQGLIAHVDYYNNTAAYGGAFFNNGNTFTMDNSWIRYNQAITDGGSIYNATGDMTINGATVVFSSTVGRWGGGIFNDSGNLTLENNSELDQNQADQGGFFYNAGGVVTMTNNTVTNNTATSDGGGIYNATGVITMTDINLSNNSAGSNGGGIYNNTGQISVGTHTEDAINTTGNTTGNTINGNQAINGGAIYNNSGQVSLLKNTINNNTAIVASAGQGGGLYNGSGGTVTIDRGNAFYDNSAHQGGGIYYTGGSGSLTMHNTLVYTNTAQDQGGGLYIGGDSPEILHNTFYQNAATASSTGQGGAIYISGGGTPTIKNNIFDANIADIGSAIRKAGSGGTYNYNDYWPGAGSSQASGITVGANSLNEDPSFVDAAGGDFHLSSTSPIINRAEAGLGVAHDFENDPRPVNGAPDIGADENDACLVQLVQTDSDGDSDPLTGNLADGPIFGSVQAALNTATLSQTIRVAVGACQENITIDKLVTIDGSWLNDFSAPFTVDIPDIGPVRYIATTIDGGNNGSVVDIQASAQAPTLSYLLLQNGNTAGNGGGIKSRANLNLINSTVYSNSAVWGGGIFLEDGLGIVATLSTGESQGVEVTNNRATSLVGGGIYVGTDNTLNMSGGEVSQNTAPVGGGIYNANGITATLCGVNISRNNATGGNGGGVYNDDNSVVNIPGSLINNNTASVHGGGLYNGPNSDITITDGSISDNTAGGNGGGMYNDSGSSIDIGGGAPIDSNQANHGGGVYNTNATFVLRQKRLNNNQATDASGDGGGIYADLNSVLTTTNLGLYNNSANDDGGGLYQIGNTQSAHYHATIRQNHADDQGGGVYAGGVSAVISASIMAFNTSGGDGSGIYGAGASIPVDYTLSWLNGYSGTTFIPTNTPTPADPKFRNTAGDLYYNSPAIDAVPTTASHVTVDRNLDPRPQMCAKDMGRDEYGVGARAMTFVDSPTPLGTTLAPNDFITYTFSLRNDSENWFDLSNESSSWGIGTGFTETIVITATTSQNWAEIVSIQGATNVVSQTTTKPHTATFDLGPGDTATIQVKVSVPIGAAANLVDSTAIQYETLQCADYTGVAAPAGASDPAETRVIEDFDFVIEPDNTGAALAGESITYTHIITNIGNVQDTYTIFPKAGFYASGQIITPASGQLTLEPKGSGQYTGAIVIRVDIRPEIAGGLIDVTSAIAQSNSTSNQKAAANTTAIGTITGTRFVNAIGGRNSIVREDELAPPSPDLDDNNCTVSGKPCLTIQHAINQAAPGDVIKIAQGTYTDTVTTTYKTLPLTQTIFITKPVTLRGGYESPDYLDPPDHLTNTTYIDPQGQGRGIFIAEEVQAGGSITIDRLFIRNGNAGQGGGTNAGGNIYNEGADLTLSASRLYNGSATNGAGLYNAGNNLLLQNSLLYSNTATANGGALYITGTATLQNNTFVDNQAVNGGAIYITDNGNVSIQNTIFATNTAASGGAVEASTAGTQPNLDYNLHFGNGASDVVNGSELNRVAGDPNPQFVDPPYLYIAGTSPARDAGTTIAGLTIDHQNSARPLGLGYDIGAYERVPVQRVLFYSDTVTIIAEGQMVVITHTLLNDGDMADTFIIDAASSLGGWTINYDQPLTYPIALTPGQSQTVVVTYTAPAGSSGQINTTVITAAGNGSQATVQDVVIVSSPRWEIGKAVTPGNTVQPGGLLTYTITITNTGEQDTTGSYTITDELPANTNFVAAIGSSPVMTTPVVKWITDTVVFSNNGTISFTYVVTVSKPLTHGTKIVNQVYTITGGSAFTDAAGAPVTVTVDAPAVLSITKTANVDTVQPGDYLTYTLTITNNASSLGPALGVVISDVLPANAVYQSSGFVPPATGNFTPTGNLLQWELTNPLTVGNWAQVTVTVRVTSPLAAQTILTNTFGVTAGNAITAPFGLLTTTIASTNNITLSKTVQPAFVVPGGTVTYTITLTNSGNGIATVTLTDQLHSFFSPNSVVYPSVVVPGRTWSISQGVTLVSFTATAPITEGDYYNQTITATYDLSQTIVSNTAPVSVTSPSLSITKTVGLTNNPAQRGDPITYTIVVANSGLVDAANVNITDTLPNFVDGSGLNQTVTVTAGESVTFTIPATVANNAPYATTISNTAYYTHTSGGNQSSITFTIELTPPAKLAISKTVQLTNNPAVQGDPITYTIVVANTGGLDADNTNITDTLPAYVNGSPLNQTVTVTAGESVTFTIYATVSNSVPYNTIITNTAYYTHTSSNGTDSESFAITGPPAATLDITKTAQLTNNPAQQGDSITYTIVVANNAGLDVSNIRITDSLPVYIDGNDLDQTVTITAGESITFTINATVSATAPYNAIITNTAYYTQPSGGGQDSDTFTVQPPLSPSDLTITKTVQLTNDPAQQGAPITYTIVVANKGSLDIANVRITDTLPGLVTGGADLDKTVTVTAGESITFTINAAVSAVAPYNAIITNTAYYTQPSGGGNDSDSFTVWPPSPGDLTITKTVAVSSAPVKLGDPITYTIIVTNNAGLDVSNIRITDTLPVEVIGADLDRTVTITAGEGIIFTIPAIVSLSAPYSQAITNTAYYTQPSGSGSAGASFVTEPAPSGVLLITKTVQISGAVVVQGDPITYTIVVANSDVISVTNVRITDTLPTYINGSNLNVTETITANDRITYTINATVSATAPHNAIITNTAYYSYAFGTGQDSASITVQPPSAGDLAITKTVAVSSSPVIQGDPITYTIEVANSGTLDISNIRITDTLPADVTGSNLDQTVTITAGESITFTINAAVVATAPYNAIITNTAYYTQPSGGGNDSAAFTIQPPSAGDLSITKTVQLTNNPAQQNDPITYTIEVANDGTLDIANVRITDTLPAYITGSNLDQTVTITAGESVTLVIPATVDATAPYNAVITNTAYYSQTSGSGNDSAAFTVQGPSPGSLTITKTVAVSSSPVIQGDPITYTIEVANGSGLDIDNVRITDTMPTYVTGSNLDQTVTITAGESVTFTIPATVIATAPYNAIITNTAYYSQSSGSGFDTATVTVQPPSPGDLSITKTVQPSNDPALRGDSITYTIVVSSSAGLDVSNIRITDTLPADVIGGNLDQTVTITAGESITFTIPATVSATAPYSQVITNTAYYTQASGGGNASASFNTLAAPPANLTITKTVAPTQADPGGTITYTLTFVNNGPSTAENVIITDQIPVTVTGLNVISSGVAITRTGGTTFSWQVQNLAQGQGGIITVSGQVNLGLSAGYIFTNTATITGSTADTDTLDNTSQAGVTILNVAPVANDDTFNTPEDTPLNGTLTAIDNNNAPLTYSIVTNPVTGTVVITNPLSGGFVYTPPNNYNGTVTFTFIVSDTGTPTLTDTATVTITVDPANDPPVVNDQTFSVDENSPNGTLVNFVIANDPELGPLTYTITAGNTNGSFAIGPTNGLITVNNSNELDYETTMTYYLTVVVSDTGNLTDTAIITIAINDVNEPPTITLIADQFTGVGIPTPPITFTIGDPETPAASLVITVTSSNQTLVPDANIGLGGSGANRTLVITPTASQTGTTTISITVSDTSLFTVETFLLTVDKPEKPYLISPPDGTFTNNNPVFFDWSDVTYSGPLTYNMMITGPATTQISTTGIRSLNLDLDTLDGDGRYTWTVRAIDQLGQSSGYTDTWTVTLDRVAPAPPPNLTSPSDGQTITTTQRPAFDWDDSSDALSGPVTYTIIITNSSGTPSISTTATSVFTPGSNLTAGVYTWTVIAYDRAGNTASSQVFTVAIQATTGDIYLPIIFNNSTGGGGGGLPDLWAKDLIIEWAGTPGPTTPVTFKVVIENIGGSTVNVNPADFFWVDFYINPTSFPTEAGHLWGTLCSANTCYGLAWQVGATLAPGAVITLTSAGGDPYLAPPPDTNWPGFFNQSGTQNVGVYVDSWGGLGVPEGYVVESNETNNSRTSVTVTGFGLTLDLQDLNTDKPPTTRPLPNK